MLGYLFIIIYPGYGKWLALLVLAGWITGWLLIYRKPVQKAWFILSLLLFLVFTWGILNYAPVQNWLVKKVTANIAEKLHTRVSIKHVDFSLFNRMELDGLLIEDHNRDTMLYAGTARVRITDWFFLKPFDSLALRKQLIDAFDVES